jgi:hypothetical protein
MDYTTIAALRKFGTLGSSKDDTLLVSLISSASRAIENYCGRRFAASAEVIHVFKVRYTSSDVITPFDGSILYLDDDLALAASAITGSPTVSYLPANTPPYYAILNEDGAWVSPISVTGYWAYSVNPPPDVEMACLRIARWMYDMRETTRGDGVVVTDQGAVLMPAGLPADVMTLLTPYRRMRFAG